MKHFSIGAHSALAIGASEAMAAGHPFIRKEHILIGICSLGKIPRMKNQLPFNEDSLRDLLDEYESVEGILRTVRLSGASFRRQLRLMLGTERSTYPGGMIHRDSECKQVFARAQQICDDFSGNQTTSAHLFSAIMENPGPGIQKILDKNNVNTRSLLENVGAVIQENRARKKIPLHGANGDGCPPPGKTPYLDRFGRNLTKDAEEGRLNPFVGRRNELKQIMQILLRKSKNNPLLIGEAGVGKTAIVEELARRILERKEGDILSGKKIIAIRAGDLLAGTRYRGDLEERITGLIDEVRNNPDIIMFIDEIHSLLGTGKGDGTVDPSNIMKPALSGGEISCIGCTTFTEYSRLIQSDKALERRFEKVIIREPDMDTTLGILKGLRPMYEEHHKVKISDPALLAAVSLSKRFDGSHHFPDKAIDLIDRACAEIRLPQLSIRLRQGPDGNPAILPDLKIDEKTIAKVLSEKMNIPEEIVLSEICSGQNTRLLLLRDFLKTKIIGQDDAIDRLYYRLLMAHTGLGERRGPLGVFLFLGPTGVGKTALAQALAEFLFGSPDDILKLDMSEYMDKASHMMLIGSPPGFIRSDEEGYLTGFLKKKPYSVVLLDEVEKAHPEIMNLFLGVFDEGRITDNRGSVIDAKNVIFIMTSNIEAFKEESPDLNKEFGVFYNDTADKVASVKNLLKQYYRVEFINRIDEVIQFNHLGRRDLEHISGPILDAIADKLQSSMNVCLTYDPQVNRYIAAKSYDPVYGARNLRRSIEDLVEKPLSQMILKGILQQDSSWHVSVLEGNLSFVPFEDGRSPNHRQ